MRLDFQFTNFGSPKLFDGNVINMTNSPITNMTENLVTIVQFCERALCRQGGRGHIVRRHFERSKIRRGPGAPEHLKHLLGVSATVTTHLFERQGGRIGSILRRMISVLTQVQRIAGRSCSRPCHAPRPLHPPRTRLKRTSRRPWHTLALEFVEYFVPRSYPYNRLGMLLDVVAGDAVFKA